MRQYLLICILDIAELCYPQNTKCSKTSLVYRFSTDYVTEVCIHDL